MTKANQMGLWKLCHGHSLKSTPQNSSSLQINHEVYCKARLRRKLACCPGLREGHADGEVHEGCLKDVCPAAQDEGIY